MDFPKEYQYSDANFVFLQGKAEELAGIHLESCKKEMVYSRVSRILRQHNLKSFDEFCEMLNSDNESYNNEFINAITTNLTFFFREKHHFEFLKSKVIPDLIIKNAKSKRIRIWSAGCSTGEEPYSIAFVFHELLSQDRSWDVKILATDIDSDVLNRARKGIYSELSAEKIPTLDVDRYFIKSDSQLAVKSDYKNLVYFKKLNLFDDEWPMSKPFDVIFCRNVMIYFVREMQLKLINRYYQNLDQNGILILGHSESVPGSFKNLKFLGNTIYRKIGS